MYQLIIDFDKCEFHFRVPETLPELYFIEMYAALLISPEKQDSIFIKDKYIFPLE